MRDLPADSLVWEPLEIGPIEVKNRIMATAHTLLYSENNLLSDRHIAYYRERAQGGAGLLITEQQAAYPLAKGTFHACCVAYDPRVVPQYAKLADAVHEYGCRQFVQLFTAGVHDQGTMFIDEWHPLWAPSRVPSTGRHEVPAVMGREQIADLVAGFGRSAQNIQQSGLDGVEIHAAHGYGIGQFLSPAYNKRTDAYGGSVRKRCRLVIEIAEEIRRCVGTNIAFGVRLSLDEFMGDAGITADEGQEQVAVLAETGLFDFFNISAGGHDRGLLAVTPMGIGEDGLHAGLAKRAKDVVGDQARVFVVGRIRDLLVADEILRTGAADMVAMTRAQIADPFLVEKTRSGRSDEIIRCVGVNECLRRVLGNREVTCALNPAAGRERQWGEGTLRRVPPAEAKRVVVIGGGLAGMKAAAVAARRGHQVCLLEAQTELGGHLNLLKHLPTRRDWQIAIDGFQRAMERSSVELRLGVEATPDEVAHERPDAVVCATGASWDASGFSPHRPERPGIPGASDGRTLDIGTAVKKTRDDHGALGKRVLIVDETGGYLPFGLADRLSEAGADVEILSPHLYLGEDILGTLDMAHLFPRLRSRGVVLTAQHFVEQIQDDAVEVHDLWSGSKQTREPIDTIVLSMLRIPNNALFEELEPALPEVHCIGDALAPRSVAAVVYEGEKLGREL